MLNELKKTDPYMIIANVVEEAVAWFDKKEFTSLWSQKILQVLKYDWSWP
jgi:hypothetical protein